jgi:hypothetical protein
MAVIGATVFFALTWLVLLTLNMVVAVLEVLLVRSLRRGVVGEHRFRLSEDGLLEETNVNRTLHAWSSVGATRQILGALMLRAGSGWHIFPRGTFSDAKARNEFLRVIKSFRERTEQNAS